MKIAVGGTEFEIPDDLIDCENFLETVLRLVPQTIHIREDEIVVRKNWQSGDLDVVGQALNSYEAVYNLARVNRCRKLRTVGTRLAEMYLNKELWYEIEWEHMIVRSHKEFEESVHNQTPEDVESFDILWKQVIDSNDDDL